MILPELGIGITYSASIEPLLAQCPEMIDVLEIEPQTLWSVNPGEEKSYWIDERALDHIVDLPVRKLVHSVGTPVGGTVRPDPSQFALLRRAIECFGAPWASDHLSFNSVQEFYTGFFLPPRQTQVGVEIVVQSIADLQCALHVPFAIETGVNYLRPRADEMDDGEFISSILEEANCGLLLDLHNIFANAVNGRQPIEEFIEQIPLDKIWEIHVAGGMEMDGFRLDAHCGPIPEPLIDFSRAIIPRLPNLKAIIFEILPVYVPIVGFDVIKEQLLILHELWQMRGRDLPDSHVTRPSTRISATTGGANSISPQEWEYTLGELAIGRRPNASGKFVGELREDPGVQLVNHLVQEFRASMIVRVLRLTSRLIMLTHGADYFRGILSDFWSVSPPQQYSYLEAEKFVIYLNKRNLPVAYLPEVLEFEWSAVRTLMDQQTRKIAFDFNPLPLLSALFGSRLPDDFPEAGDFAIEITPDGPSSASGIDLNDVRRILPFH